MQQSAQLPNQLNQRLPTPYCLQLEALVSLRILFDDASKATLGEVVSFVFPLLVLALLVTSWRLSIYRLEGEYQTNLKFLPSFYSLTGYTRNNEKFQLHDPMQCKELGRALSSAACNAGCSSSCCANIRNSGTAVLVFQFLIRHSEIYEPISLHCAPSYG